MRDHIAVFEHQICKGDVFVTFIECAPSHIKIILKCAAEMILVDMLDRDSPNAKGTLTIMYKDLDCGTGSVANFFLLLGSKKRVGPYFDGLVGKPESQHAF